MCKKNQDSVNYPEKILALGYLSCVVLMNCHLQPYKIFIGLNIFCLFENCHWQTITSNKIF